MKFRSEELVTPFDVGMVGEKIASTTSGQLRSMTSGQNVKRPGDIRYAAFLTRTASGRVPYSRFLYSDVPFRGLFVQKRERFRDMRIGRERHSEQRQLIH